MGKVFKDKPMSEITLRRFERPTNDDLDSLVRKFCISLGLLQPGDSRDVIVDIFKLLLEGKKQNKTLTSKEIEVGVKAVRDKGTAGSNIRRQLHRLEIIGIVEKFEGGYRLREFMNLGDVLDSHVLKFLIEPTLERIREYADQIDKKV